jgi:SAM-dependent methyltransferase
MSAEYHLENYGEFERLEVQAQQKNYSIDQELSSLKVNDNDIILDAGCGSGLLSRHLVNTYDNIKVHACDRSSIRVQQAREYSQVKGCGDIIYSEQGLEKTTFPDNNFDTVISRYVIEHLDNPQAVINELYRITKPGGQAYLIDVDGLFLNFFSLNERLNELLNIVNQSMPIDLFVGRKLGPMLLKAGFKNVKWSISTHVFDKLELAKEYENNKVRCQFIRPLLIKILGDDKIADEFIHLYLKEMRDAQNTYFYNKFVAMGTK